MNADNNPWLTEKLEPIVAKLKAVEKEHRAKFGKPLFDNEIDAIEGYYFY
jgi:hypothetical protein